jgi:hypothetical protein
VTLTSNPTYLSTLNPDLYTCSPFSVSLTNSATTNYASCTFTGCGGSTLTIAANCPCGGDTYAILYDSTNTVLLASNDDSCGLCSKITYVVPGSPATCTNFILHEGCYSTTSCSGTFTVQSQRPPTASPTYTPNPTSIPTSSPTFLPTFAPSGPTFTPTIAPSFNFNKCYAGTDFYSPFSSYVICDVNPQRAWLSFINSYSYYHIAAICQSLGYANFGQVGGNCGSVCGYCDGTHSCSSTGLAVGTQYGYTITWNCVGKPYPTSIATQTPTQVPSSASTVVPTTTLKPTTVQTLNPTAYPSTLPTIISSTTSNPSIVSTLVPTVLTTNKPSASTTSSPYPSRPSTFVPTATSRPSVVQTFVPTALSTNPPTPATTATSSVAPSSSEFETLEPTSLA